MARDQGALVGQVVEAAGLVLEQAPAALVAIDRMLAGQDLLAAQLALLVLAGQVAQAQERVRAAQLALAAR